MADEPAVPPAAAPPPASPAPDRRADAAVVDELAALKKWAQGVGFGASSPAAPAPSAKPFYASPFGDDA
jgi:hypothetical protein